MSKYRIVIRNVYFDDWYYAQFKLFGLFWVDFATFESYDEFGGRSLSIFPEKVEAFIENKIKSPKAKLKEKTRIYKTY